METYKIIEGFENYSVSDFGNVKNNKTGRQLKPGKDTLGYEMVNLTSGNKSRSTKKVHRLVACGFLENPNNKCFVDHIDNNSSNNGVVNLRWATASENSQNRQLNKNSKTGQKGVYFHKASQKYEARISIDGIKIHLGLFINLEDANKRELLEQMKHLAFSLIHVKRLFKLII